MDVNVQNNRLYGATPLMEASGSGQMDIVRLLLRHGADIHARDQAEQTAATWAAVMGHRAVVELLRTAGAEIGLLEAAAIGDIEMTRRLLDQGADANMTFPDRTTVLFYAACNGQAETVRLLLDRGAYLEPDDGFGTALAHAVRKGHVETVRVLLEAGANPNKMTLSGPILVNAAFHGYTEIVRLLLDYGADVHALDINDYSAMTAAQERGHTAVVALLKQAGAKE